MTESAQRLPPSPEPTGTAGRRSRRNGLWILGLLIVFGTALLISGSGHKSGPFRFFSASSFWNHPLAANAPVDPASAVMVSHLLSEVNQEVPAQDGPNINTNAFSVPVYTVGSGQATTRVILDIHNAALQASFSAVPLAANAHPATGSDGNLVVWQPSTDKMWEFWQLHRAADGWHASWGGAMRNVQLGDGLYGPKSWPGAQYYWGVSASSLPVVGGLMMINELKRLQIPHILALAIPDPREHVWSWPAQRTDGQSTDPASLPEGARLRLDPKLNIAALHLPPLTRAMAIAAQRYGIVVRDTSGVISFYAQDPTPTGTEPYFARNGVFRGLNPRQLMASFPWQHLEVLKLDLHGS